MGLVSGPFYVAAALLAVAGVFKLRDQAPTSRALLAMNLPSARPMVVALGLGEVALGSWAVLSGGMVPAILVGCAYLAFAAVVSVALVGRKQLATCGCFGRADAPPHVSHLILNLGAATAAIAAAAAPVAGIGAALAEAPAAGGALVTATLPAMYLGLVAFSLMPQTLARLKSPAAGSGVWKPTTTERLAIRSGEFLDSRMSRRGFISRAVMVGAALSVAPVDFVLKPGSAYAAICSCSGQACNCGATCCDGYTEFCCTTTGSNSCPPGTLPAGWWKADGSGLCDVSGTPQPRYYFDCNTECDAGCGCGPSGICSSGCTECDCHCAGFDCGNRKECCTNFRYGQCNADVTCIGAIVCRVVTCTPPWQWDPACGQTVATDNNTRWHDAPCLHTDPSGEVYPPGGIVVMGDWTGNGVPTPGIFYNGVWYLRYANSDGPADLIFSFGDPGDLPIVGDWNGDGRETPGVVRSGRWYLRNSCSAGPADVSFTYGNTNDRPVVGDWNGDGIDTPGVVRDGVWHLRNSNSPGPADLVFAYGDPGDIPVVGDWNGDGTDTPGVVRGDKWMLRNSSSPGSGEIEFRFGNPSDEPIVGDWDGDGVETPGVVRGSSWYLRNDASGGVANVAFSYGSAANVGL